MTFSTLILTCTLLLSASALYSYCPHCADDDKKLIILACEKCN